jgi:hypothetical protein
MDFGKNFLGLILSVNFSFLFGVFLEIFVEENRGYVYVKENLN